MTIRDTVRIARDRGVSIGAHPSFPDKLGFGRREMKFGADELRHHLVAQIEILAEACAAAGTTLNYVKPHGALYNLAARDRVTADLIADSIRAVNPSLVLLGLAGNQMLDAARAAGIGAAAEAFADRAYSDDGTLVPRGEKGALLDSPGEIAARAITLVKENRIVTRSGTELKVQADSICTHGDGPNAFEILKRLREDLEGAGIGIAPFV